MHTKIAMIMFTIWIGFLVAFILASMEDCNSAGSITAASVIFVLTSIAFSYTAYKLSNSENTIRKVFGMRRRNRNRDDAREILGSDTDSD